VGARFSSSVHTGPGTYPVYCTMGTGSFPGVKRPGHGADHPPPSKCRGHERVELYLYSPSGHQWPVIGRTNQPTTTCKLKKYTVLRYEGSTMTVPRAMGLFCILAKDVGWVFLRAMDPSTTGNTKSLSFVSCDNYESQTNTEVSPCT
jgi:hypothetical protein